MRTSTCRAFRPGVRGEVALSVDRRRDCVLRAREGDEERVALRVDLVTAVGGERGSRRIRWCSASTSS